MTGWLIALAILVALAILPLGVSARYDADGPLVRIIAGPIRLQVYPQKKKDRAAKEKKPKKQKKTPPAKAADQQPKSPIPEPKPIQPPKQGGDLRDFLPLLDVAMDLLHSFGRKLRVNFLQLHLVLAGDDPCDLAVNYGRANAAGAALMAQLERLLVIRRRDVRIDCDFVADTTRISARLDLTVTLGRLLSLATVYGLRGLFTYLKIKKQREGGASI